MAFPIIIVILAFAFVWYYYSLINGVVTAKGDEFEVVDDWKYTSKEIHNELRSYLGCNQALHVGQDNPNCQDALHILEELNIIFDRYSELEAV